MSVLRQLFIIGEWVCGRESFLRTWISLLWAFERECWHFPLGWEAYIYLPVVPHVHILSSARSTSNFYAGGIHWHCERHECVPGGYEVTFYFNPLIHLLSLMFWCNTECKHYFDIPEGEHITYCGYNGSTFLKTRVSLLTLNSVKADISWRQWHATHEM